MGSTMNSTSLSTSTRFNSMRRLEIEDAVLYNRIEQFAYRKKECSRTVSMVQSELQWVLGKVDAKARSGSISVEEISGIRELALHKTINYSTRGR